MILNLINENKKAKIAFFPICFRIMGRKKGGVEKRPSFPDANHLFMDRIPNKSMFVLVNRSCAAAG